MKFTVSMKNPDALDYAIGDAAAGDEKLVKTLKKLCEKWFTYGEYLDVEIDTEAKTCTVLKARP